MEGYSEKKSEFPNRNQTYGLVPIGHLCPELHLTPWVSGTYDLKFDRIFCVLVRIKLRGQLVFSIIGSCISLVCISEHIS